MVLCNTTTSKRYTNPFVPQGQVAIPWAGVLTLVLLNLHTMCLGGWWDHCCHVEKRSWSIIKVYYSIPAHTVLYFARHVLTKAPLPWKKCPFSQLTWMKSLWDTVLSSMIKYERICPSFWGHSVLFFFSSSFWKSRRITRQIIKSANDQLDEWWRHQHPN